MDLLLLASSGQISDAGTRRNYGMADRFLIHVLNRMQNLDTKWNDSCFWGAAAGLSVSRLRKGSLMHQQNCDEYYAERAAKSRILAERAGDPAIAAIHLELAARYDRLISPVPMLGRKELLVHPT